MASILETVRKVCLEQGFKNTYNVALSGGLDSTVLLHLLVQLRFEFPLKLKAIHVHHGLSPHADEWVLHCEKVCRALQVELMTEKIQLHSFSSESLENKARQLRYEIFSKKMTSQDVLLTAHHQDDQAETLLLQLFRGAGPKGLSAMPRVKSFAEGFHCRPLLDFSREVLQFYAKENKLNWIDDESNANTKFTRNFIRHDVMPLLQARWPTISTTLSRSAMHCGEAQSILEDFIQQDLIFCLQGEALSVKSLQTLSLARQREVLRLWILQQHFPLPSTIKMQHILQDVLAARLDRCPIVSWDEVELRRYRDQIFLMKKVRESSRETFLWDFKKPLDLGEQGILRAERVLGKGLSCEIEKVAVRFRQGGEKFQLPGRTHRHELKKLFQSWGVLPWVREQTPLVFVGEELAAIVGLSVSATFSVNESSYGWQFILMP